jgi:hypothetical protein
VSFEGGEIVIVHLVNPTEKLWGVMHRLDSTGVTLRGINVESFEDWIAQINRDQPQALGLATMFVPLFRVERIFLDEQIGEVESYCQRFERRVGMEIETYLTLDSTDPDQVPS